MGYPVEVNIPTEHGVINLNKAKLEELKEKHPLIGDVRGMGLLQAIELVRDRRTKEPAATEAAAVMEAARESGLLVGKGGLFGNTIRISPPMNIGAGDVDEFVRRLDASLARVEATTRTC